MQTLSWTLVAILVIGLTTDVHSRSIDPTVPSAVVEEEKAVSEAVDKAAEILTVEAVGDVVEKALEAEVEREAAEKEKTIAQVMKLAETEAVKEILADVTKKPTNNIPVPDLQFETGASDKDNELAGTRDKRTVGQVGKLANCLFTILVNPNCFQEMRASGGGGGLFGGLLGGGRGSSSSKTSSRQEAYNRQLRQWMQYQRRQIAKLNETEGGNYTTPFPIIPPSPPPEDDEPTTERPAGFINQVIQFKLNLIPNLFRTARSLFSSILPFIQNLGGGGGGSGGGGLGALFGGLGGGGSGGSSSFGNNNYESSYERPSSSISLGDSVSSSGSSSSSLSSSGGSGSAVESSTYRISLG